MNILVIGDTANLAECEQKFGHNHEFILANDHREAQILLQTYDLIFDFIIDEDPYQFEIYTNHGGSVFLNTAKISLAQLIQPFLPLPKGKFFGFNGVPTFLPLPLFEVSLYKSEDRAALQEHCKSLNTAYKIVDDRVGLITLRIISMIINEAYFTVQERTATEEDIELAMKLGTNYPYGPFEWARRIGIKHVYEVLEALYDDTKDGRYKICPALKKQYLASA